MSGQVNVLVLGLSAIGLSSSIVAGTVIEMKYGEADRGTVTIEGNWARTDRALSPQRYLLANLDTGEIYAVSLKRREIAVLSATAANADLPTTPMPEGTELRQAGKGPRIGSFATEHYEVRIKDRVCGDIYIAPKIKNKDFDRFEKAMSDYSHTMNRQMLARAEGKGMTADVCDIAALAVEPQVRELGRVMRYSREGKTAMEVLAIHRGVTVEAENLQLPEDYRRVDMLPPLAHKEARTKIP